MRTPRLGFMWLEGSKWWLGMTDSTPAPAWRTLERQRKCTGRSKARPGAENHLLRRQFPWAKLPNPTPIPL